MQRYILTYKYALKIHGQERNGYGLTFAGKRDEARERVETKIKTTDNTPKEEQPKLIAIWLTDWKRAKDGPELIYGSQVDAGSDTVAKSNLEAIRANNLHLVTDTGKPPKKGARHRNTNKLGKLIQDIIRVPKEETVVIATPKRAKSQVYKPPYEVKEAQCPVKKS